MRPPVELPNGGPQGSTVLTIDPDMLRDRYQRVPHLPAPAARATAEQFSETTDGAERLPALISGSIPSPYKSENGPLRAMWDMAVRPNRVTQFINFCDLPAVRLLPRHPVGTQLRA